MAAYVLAVALGLAGLCSSLSAQDTIVKAPAATRPVTSAQQAPEVSEVSKLRLQTFAQQAENAQLRKQLAQAQYELGQADYDKSHAALEALVRSLQVDGYVLDLQTLTYTAKPADQASGKKDDSVK
jgi:hypothetical protein